MIRMLVAAILILAIAIGLSLVIKSWFPVPSPATTSSAATPASDQVVRPVPGTGGIHSDRPGTVDAPTDRTSDQPPVAAAADKAADGAGKAIDPSSTTPTSPQAGDSKR